MYSTQNILMPVTHQSVSYIISDSITWISSELQRVLNNRREHQEVFSSFTLQLSCLTWNYLVESLKVPEHVKTKVVTFSMMYNKDLSSLRVKSRRSCLIFLRGRNCGTLSAHWHFWNISGSWDLKEEGHLALPKFSSPSKL